MPGELRGQAIIMAEFRALAEFRAAGLAQDGRAGDLAQTLVLSVPREGPARRRAPRHRARRRAAPAATRRVGTLIGAAATAVVLAAVVLAGYVPGPFHRLAIPSSSAPSAAQHGGNSSSPKVEGSASKESKPTAPPTASGSATPQQAEAIGLCNAAYAFVNDPRHSVSWKQGASLLHQLRQLIDLAGGVRQVRDYCTPYVGDLFPDGIPKAFLHLPGTGDQGPGSSQVSQDNQSGAVAHP
jgi:hypothetical protein